jgi:hypothetical protein
MTGFRMRSLLKLLSDIIVEMNVVFPTLLSPKTSTRTVRDFFMKLAK